MRAGEKRQDDNMAVPAPAPDSWVHPAAIIRPSPIAGSGLFATERLIVGTVVLRLGGHLVTGDDLQRRLAEAAADSAEQYVDAITVDRDVHLIVPAGSPVHFGNHSCDPSLWFVDPYSFSARHDIEPGEELTSDYGTTTGISAWEMDCCCGSAACRRRVTGDDWREPDLQRRYGQHWTPGLRCLIAGEDR
jgi:uncharacterized protein